MTMFYPGLYGTKAQYDAANLEEDDLFEDEDEFGDGNAMSGPPKPCTHEWVWSGNPHGQVWCKHCDTDYAEQHHGKIPDLSKRLAY